jgi:enoyl-CoA hydratase
MSRPDALNALSVELRGAMVAAFESLARDPSVEVVVLTGAGRAFSVGLDLKELGDESAASARVRSGDPAIAVVPAMEAFDRPIIGAVNGFAVTGGFEVALACDLIVCSTEARFADTHARVGVVPGWGLSQRLSRLIGPARAKELSLTGNYLDAEQAYQWGLANRVVAPDELLAVCTTIASDIMSTEPVTRSKILGLIDDGQSMGLEAALEMERTASREHMNRNVSARSINQRFHGVRSRGREQSG